MHESNLFSYLLAIALATFAIIETNDQDERHPIESAVLQIVEAIDVPATAVGPIRNVDVIHGVLVSQGQILATIEDNDVQLNLKQSKVELNITKAQAESNVDIEFAKKSRQVALIDFKRAQDSNRKYAGVVSDREMDRLRLLVEQSAAELEKIKFDKTLLEMQQQLKLAVVEKNNNEVERHVIKSPISGQVVEIKKRAGEWVNLADPMFKIVRLDRLRIEEYLPVDIANNEIVGASASFVPLRKPDGDGNVAVGKVVFVSPEINPLNSTVLVWIEFENADLHFRPGMKGRVSIKLGNSEKKTAQSKQ